MASSRSRDIAQEAYHEAIRYLERELRGDQRLPELLESTTTIQDVKDVVEEAQRKYESSSKETGAGRWLRRFSAGIIYYGQVLDIVSQYHPKYVALAWGTVKFVLTGVIKHKKLVVQLSRALARIGDALQQTQLSAELYQMESMKEAIARLFAHIILFFQKTVKWYNMTPAGRVVSSIFKPLELDYDESLKEIKLCSQAVNNIANGASRAELRNIHTIIEMQNQQLKERDDRLHEMQKQLNHIQEKIDISTTSILQVATSHKAITEKIHIEVMSINPRIYDIQFSNIMNILQPKESPEETLQKVQSFARRLQVPSRPSRDSADLLACLGQWVSREGPSLFLVRVGLRAEWKAKEFATDVIKILQPLPYGVIWKLSWSSHKDGVSPLEDMIRSLIFQALRYDPTLLHNYPDELNVTKFQAQHTEVEWVSLVTHLFSRLSKCFLVIEAEDVFQAHHTSPEWPRRFLELFQSLVDQAESTGNLLKILVVGYGPTPSTVQSVPGKDNRIVSCIQSPVPVPPKFRRRFASDRRHLAAWQDLKPRF